MFGKSVILIKYNTLAILYFDDISNRFVVLIKYDTLAIFYLYDNVKEV